MTEAQSGYLLLADISGYTAFLSESELEHARDTRTDLLGVLIDHARPPLVPFQEAPGLGRVRVSAGPGAGFGDRR